MHLSRFAEQHPDKPAVIAAATGRAITYRELDDTSRRLANLLAAHGIGLGDHVALLFDNVPEYFIAAWAAQRSGVLWTPVNHHLTAEEAAYIVRDCGAKALFAVGGGSVTGLAAEVARLAPEAGLRVAFTGAIPGFSGLDAALAPYDTTEREGEREGHYMFYSSGTTGRPKGIVPPVSGEPFGTGLRLEQMLPGMFGVGEDTVYLCPAPLYHAAPTGWSMGMIRNGGTVVLMHRFDAEQALALIQKYRVTHVQFVPTHMIRILALPEAVRTGYDVGSLRRVVHAAAPCPVEVKRRVIDWLGPIVLEYYAGSEGNCFFLIDSEDWLAHPGSVGRMAAGTAHVVDDDGTELPVGEVGNIWFEGGGDFTYHNDPEKTARAHNDRGWSTLGDVGRLDEDGYLYLVDRRADLIISGGVNIYPQEVENTLALHPAVTDVAVIGLPDPEFGKRVHAVVQPKDFAAAGPELEAEIIGYCRDHLAHFKCPRSVSFMETLPRTPTGKLLRRLLAGPGAPSTAAAVPDR